MSEPDRHVWTQADRDEAEEHYRALAELLLRKGAWAGKWRVEVDGCVFRFTVTGYPKAGTPVWHEREAEKAGAAAGFGPG
jgi:hypothetical protein